MTDTKAMTMEMMTMICKTDCIYFPQFYEFRYWIDDDGVKHRVNNKKYICLYTDNKICVGSKCKRYKPYSSINTRINIFDKEFWNEL